MSSDNYKLDVGTIRNITEQIFLALCFVHEKGCIHRGIKPENVLLRGDVCKVVDFGLTRETR